MNPPPDQPWLSANPRDTMGMYATMLRGAAAGKEFEAARNAAVAADFQQRQQIASVTRLAGETTIEGRRAFDLVASEVDHRQVSDDGELTITRLDLAVDAVEYVPLRLTMHGTLRDGGETRAVTIERHDQDYRRVQGCGDLYRPFRTVVRISGIMSAEQQAQMQEAQAKLEEFDIQLQSMPAAHRNMIMRQMGPQMEMMRKMSSGEGLEVVSNVVDLRCNVPMPSPLELAQATFGGNLAAAGGGAFGTSYGDARTGPASPTAAAPTADESAALRAAQQACLEKKMAAAQNAGKKKQAFGLIMNAVRRTATRLANFDLVRTVDDVYEADATAVDLAEAAKNLGLTEDDLAACKNPH